MVVVLHGAVVGCKVGVVWCGGGGGGLRWWVVRSVCFTRVSVHSRARVQRITDQSPRESNSRATAPVPTGPNGRYTTKTWETSEQIE